jgi:hypothetical protein
MRTGAPSGCGLSCYAPECVSLVCQNCLVPDDVDLRNGELITNVRVVRLTAISLICDQNVLLHFTGGHAKLAFVCVSHSICATNRSIVELWEQMCLTIIYTLAGNI